MSKKLVKGLDAIFGEGLAETIKEIEESSDVKNRIINVLLNKIIPNPFQPRKLFDEEKLDDLANSIKENGVLSPVILKETKGGEYYIIAGERRTRASRIANKKKIPAIIMKASDKKMAELAIIENVQREDLNPFEEAIAINFLMKDYKMTQIQVAKVLGKSRVYVSNQLRLLKLEQKIIDGIITGKVTYGQVRPLISLSKSDSLRIYERILLEELTSRDVENIIKAQYLRDAKANKNKLKIKKSSELIYAEDLIRSRVKSRVVVTDNVVRGTDIGVSDNGSTLRVDNNIKLLSPSF
jgi:ParB family chromosome partitioning protein